MAYHVHHILITSGNKPYGNIQDHPAARAQVAAIRNRWNNNLEIEISYIFDYSRKVVGLRSLPNLLQFLSNIKRSNLKQAVYCNLARIIRATHRDKREALVDEISKFGENIFSATHNKKFSNFSGAEIEFLLRHADLSRSADRKNNPAASKINVWSLPDARSESLLSRRKRAATIRKRLLEIQASLQNDGSVSTNKSIADEANRLGYTTSRGKPWTRQNVARALLERETKV